MLNVWMKDVDVNILQGEEEEGVEEGGGGGGIDGDGGVHPRSARRECLPRLPRSVTRPSTFRNHVYPDNKHGHLLMNRINGTRQFSAGEATIGTEAAENRLQGGMKPDDAVLPPANPGDAAAFRCFITPDWRHFKASHESHGPL
ncbi:hypothetical protein E2C01_036023 [Portunus trituberculatus]|uniref:Uncharacterized protein n=1 Tax=Portunus trituberculatus TaxID=210409 RepID=A0A5B7F5S7_PORTR|nr:hypothetical protein [Portunus trituberculatus]